MAGIDFTQLMGPLVTSSSADQHRANLRQVRRNSTGGITMAWKTPKIAEVCVGMEINMYACATRK